MPLKDVILGVLSAAAEQTEEISIEAALQSLHDSDKETWARVTDDLKFAAGKIKVNGKFAQAMIEGIGIAAQESIDANPDA